MTPLDFNFGGFDEAGFGLDGNGDVRLVPYSPKWKELFNLESQRIMSALEIEGARIFHIGSTSIPDIHAKPVLDMLMAVHSLRDLDSRAKMFESLGYEVRGEYGLEGRRYFVLKRGNKAYVHLHCWERDRVEIMRHLLFRSYLRLRPEIAKKYEAVKLISVGSSGSKRSDYQEAKNPVIDEIMLQALAWATSPEARLHYSAEWIVSETPATNSELSVQILSGVEARAVVDSFYESVGSGHRARDEDTFFVLMNEGKVIGTVRHCFENDFSMLRSMNVHPDYRGKKLGVLLLNAFENFLNDKQIRETFCLPYSHLLSFYGQIGFTPLAEIEAPNFLRERLQAYRTQYPEKEFSVMCRRWKGPDHG